MGGGARGRSGGLNSSRQQVSIFMFDLPFYSIFFTDHEASAIVAPFQGEGRRWEIIEMMVSPLRNWNKDDSEKSFGDRRATTAIHVVITCFTEADHIEQLVAREIVRAPYRERLFTLVY